MPQHRTITGPATHADPYSLFLDILHAATGQDGTFETAQENLHTIEDLASVGLRVVTRENVEIIAAIDRVDELCGKAMAILDAR